jgi:hypothetical protein
MKQIVLILIALAVVGGVVYWASVRESGDGATATYSTKEACELATAKECAYAYGCDVAPCPKDANGWVPLPTSRTVAVFPGETENWQTFRNEEYGFEFRYPQELTLQTLNPLLFRVNTVLLVMLNVPQGNNEFMGIGISVRTPDKTKVHNAFYIPPTVKTIIDLRAQLQKNINESNAVPDSEEKIYMDFVSLSINGVEALQVESAGGGGTYRFILFLRNGFIYEVGSRKTPFVDENTTLQIAKTFRFLE